MNNKAVITSTIGYMCLALTGWMISMPNAGWYDSLYPHGMAMMFPLGIVLGVMGILAFLCGRALDSIIFFGGAGLFLASHLAAGAMGAGEPASYMGWYAFVWAVFFCWVWFGSFKAGIVRMLFLLGLWLTMLALAIGGWGSLHGFTILGGYLGLATAILAAITSAIDVICHGMRGNPNDEARTV